MARPGCEPETRIAIVDVETLDADTLRTLTDEAALVAPCLGYRSATLPIIDQAGHLLPLRADANGDAVGDDCRLVLADGSVLPNVYGIGLGTGFRPSRGMGCEPNFSGQANSLSRGHCMRCAVSRATEWESATHSRASGRSARSSRRLPGRK